MNGKQWAGRLVAFASVGALAGCSAAVVQADYPHYGTVADLANASTAVVTVTIGDSHQDILYPLDDTSTDPQKNPRAGTAESQEPAQGNDGIDVTVYEALVDEVFLGEIRPGDHLEVYQLGGDHTIEAGGVPLVRGDRYVLFLETYPGGVPAAIVGGSQGQFFVNADGSLSPAFPESPVNLTRDELSELSR